MLWNTRMNQKYNAKKNFKKSYKEYKASKRKMHQPLDKRYVNGTTTISSVVITYSGWAKF